MKTKLKDYLRLVKQGARPPAHIWGEQAREALNERYVRVGWGGRLDLMPAGEKALRTPIQGEER